jgi:hypothetical protein
MLSPAAILAFAALNNTPPVALPKGDVDAVATAMSTRARSFEECMGKCFSPRTGECMQRGVSGNYGLCQPRSSSCLNATHSGAQHSLPVPDLRCAPFDCTKNLHISFSDGPGYAAPAGTVLVRPEVYTFNGTRVGVDIAALLASLDSGVAGELAMIRSYFGTYNNATSFLVSTGYVGGMGNPTLLPKRYPRADRLAHLLATMPPALFKPNATVLGT